jgi:hypothetical protein
VTAAADYPIVLLRGIMIASKACGGIGGEMEKEREAKVDGRYIIFYTFEDEGAEATERSGEEGSD